ncbi:MAG: acetyl-CoA carboxylase biotin carboxylase subunit [Ignavibacteriae bacterium]|nr:acetyl-CoA carboxylase biotin carboxylase subunit [Ignavibacteriota bacterium]MCB9216100.1 acetyl-CoA carboxylase biotin carboxylase subunit [Ignavibacteria bacterium]
MKKLLIANRGEIARRIIRTAERMGIETVAIYSDIDTPAPYVQEATEAYRLPGVTPGETYLRVDAVLDIAKRSGADAIHPGYGFLSENALFAKRCAEANITFVGPSPEAIEHLGSKTNARRLAIDSGVPVMPGTTSGVASLEEARKTAEEIGYPVLLKAAAGGGGKGMRVVREASELESGLRAAQGEAMTAFGDDEVFVEKYVEEPRHIEIQVVADQQGNILVLGERECSIQRRHQKVVEEAPSVALDDDLRKRMFASAEKLVAAANYTNAGTLEFLLDSSGNYYFLEVNTRLQVEHPVTEMVTGLDLVELQIRVARGEELPVKTEEIVRRGHAIECRICAEDSYDNFLPSIGRIFDLREPVGEGIRVESSIYPGMEVSLYYDPMIAKLVCWGEDRNAAIAQTLEALDNYHIAGVATTIPFCRSVLQNEDFRSGNFSTGYVKKHWVEPKQEVSDDLLRMAAAAAILTEERVRERVEGTAS